LRKPIPCQEVVLDRRHYVVCLTCRYQPRAAGSTHGRRRVLWGDAARFTCPHGQPPSPSYLRFPGKPPTTSHKHSAHVPGNTTATNELATSNAPRSDLNSYGSQTISRVERRSSLRDERSDRPQATPRCDLFAPGPRPDQQVVDSRQGTPNDSGVVWVIGWRRRAHWPMRALAPTVSTTMVWWVTVGS
jgi:hypothetical protein